MLFVLALSVPVFCRHIFLLIINKIQINLYFCSHNKQTNLYATTNL